MAWSGLTATITPSDLRATLDLMRDDDGGGGFVVRCACGAARYCPEVSAETDLAAFDQLHSDCEDGG